MTLSPRAAAALAGASAGAIGLATAELAAALLHARVSPVLAVGEAIIELTPGAVAERAISVVGRADKPLLVIGVLCGLLIGSALAGVVMLRHRGLGTTALVALPVVALVAAITRADARAADMLPAVVGGVVGLMVALWLVPRSTVSPSAPPERAHVASRSPSRRVFLRDVGLTLLAAGVVGGASRWAGSARRSVEEARRKVRLTFAAPTAPSGVELGVPGISPWTTPTDTFYRIDTSLAPPLIKPADWVLRIHGMVERELRLSYSDLVERGLTDSWVTLCCVSNEVGGELIGNALWSGVRMDDLLAEAGPLPEADALLSTSRDGWTCGTPLSALTDGRDALLAVAMNGEPLPVEHGFPVRMVVPGLYGFVSATKWVVDWKVTRFDDVDAYWTQRGWAEQCVIKTQSRIDIPRGGSAVPAGTVNVGGVAWAQHRGISRVEVRIDDGDWEEATLAREPTTDTWVQWVWQWPAETGRHTVTVRATDGDGVTQPEQRTEVIPDGASGWHSATIDVAT